MLLAADRDGVDVVDPPNLYYGLLQSRPPMLRVDLGACGVSGTALSD
jgi:hypothetical protein